MSRQAVAAVAMALAFVAHGGQSFEAARSAPLARGPSWEERRGYYEGRIKRDARLRLHEAQFWKAAAGTTSVEGR